MQRQMREGDREIKNERVRKREREMSVIQKEFMACAAFQAKSWLRMRLM